MCAPVCTYFVVIAYQGPDVGEKENINTYLSCLPPFLTSTVCLSVCRRRPEATARAHGQPTTQQPYHPGGRGVERLGQWGSVWLSAPAASWVGGGLGPLGGDRRPGGGTHTTSLTALGVGLPALSELPVAALCGPQKRIVRASLW